MLKFKRKKREEKFEDWLIRKYASHLPLIDLFIEAKYGKRVRQVGVDKLRKEIQNFMQKMEEMKNEE